MEKGKGTKRSALPMSAVFPHTHPHPSSLDFPAPLHFELALSHDDLTDPGSIRQLQSRPPPSPPPTPPKYRPTNMLALDFPMHFAPFPRQLTQTLQCSGRHYQSAATATARSGR
jgi:hypothetical protein